MFQVLTSLWKRRQKFQGPGLWLVGRRGRPVGIVGEKRRRRRRETRKTGKAGKAGKARKARKTGKAGKTRKTGKAGKAGRGEEDGGDPRGGRETIFSEKNYEGGFLRFGGCFRRFVGRFWRDAGLMRAVGNFFPGSGGQEIWRRGSCADVRREVWGPVCRGGGEGRGPFGEESRSLSSERGRFRGV
jgi:hypothetical protein